MRPLKTALLSLPFCLSALMTPAAAEVTLHLYGYEGEPVNAVIDWGSPEANASCDRNVQGAGRSVTCPLVQAGAQIRISGTVPQFGPGEASQVGNTVARVVSWGDVGLKSLDGAFRNVDRISQVPTSLPLTVRNAARMFQGAAAFSQDLSGWGMSTRNVSLVQDMFDGALAQNSDLSRWCLRNVPSEPVGFKGNGQHRRPAFAAHNGKMPRFGQCGVTFGVTSPSPGAAGQPFLFSPVAEVWPNKPAAARFEATGLPAGLTIDPLTGVISGTPDEPGTWTVEVRLVEP